MKRSKSLILLGFSPFCLDVLAETSASSYYGVQPVTVNLNRYAIVQPQVVARQNVYPRWYIGANLFANYANFETKHLTNGVYNSADPYAKDKFSIWQMGGGISLGQKFNSHWRLEGEVGWFGKYSEDENAVEFGVHAPYVIANVMYDFDIGQYGGFYLGAGVGAAFPTTHLASWRFFAGDENKTSVSPMGALMLGWQYPISDKFYLDIKYRLSGYEGTEHTRRWMDTNNVVYDFTNKMGFVLNNALSFGVRYEF